MVSSSGRGYSESAFSSSTKGGSGAGAAIIQFGVIDNLILGGDFQGQRPTSLHGRGAFTKCAICRLKRPTTSSARKRWRHTPHNKCNGNNRQTTNRRPIPRGNGRARAELWKEHVRNRRPVARIWDREQKRDIIQPNNSPIWMEERLNNSG